jgi:pyruvate/2-oxoglutarate dehydrogenase complex dihydrolipoamide dehydrogenase (E3) component
MAERFDVIIIGMGPGGEAWAGRLLAAGKARPPARSDS